MPRRNEEISRLLHNIAKFLILGAGEDHFRIRAYEEAARTIAAMDEDIDELRVADRLEDIPGVGASIAAKVAEYLDTGRCAYYEDLKRTTPSQAVALLGVPSIGPARAKLLSERLGITTIPQLEQAATNHLLRRLPGIGAKLEEKIGREASRVSARSQRMLLGVALTAAEEVVAALQSHPAVQEITPAGSIRRMKETIGDIELLVASERPAEVVDAFVRQPFVAEVLMHGPTRGSALTRDRLQVDLRSVSPDAYGAALLYFTGSKEHTIALRTLALARGWKLSEYGLFDAHGQRIASRTEQDIYQALGMVWIPPELRELRGELEAAQRHQLPHLVKTQDIQGDLHMHTTWSDGYDSPEHLVEGALARGYHYLALTDHSRSLRVARGLSIERVREQRQLIDELNSRYAPLRILHGAEIDILPDGTLDYPDELLAELDLVTISVHTALGQPREQMTARVIAALRNPYVDVLNHPTSRLLLHRAESDLDLEAVIQAAVEQGVALEIDGQPDRLDLDDVWARRAREAGAMLVCNSDAHAARQLDYVRYAVATARRGWVEPQGVLNTLPLEALSDHFGRHHPGKTWITAQFTAQIKALAQV